MTSNARKGLLCSLQAKQAQISHCICIGWSGPSLSTFRIIIVYCSICPWTENARMRLHGCACWSGPLLFAYDIRALYAMLCSIHCKTPFLVAKFKLVGSIFSSLLSEKFDQFWTVNKRLMECSGDDTFKYIPYRIYQVLSFHFLSFLIPCHTVVVGYHGYTLDTCVSVHPSVVPISVCQYFHFRTITWANISGFSPNLVCALILWRWFGIADGQMSSIFYRVVCRTHILIFVSRC